MYNKVMMIGRLTRDVELKYLPSGSAIANSSIATNHTYKTATGEKKEEVCYLDFNVFGKSAEILNQYVRKGSQVMLEGRLIFEQWQGNDGSNRNRHTLRVESFKFLDSKGDSMGGGMNTGGGYNQPQVQEQPSYSQPQQNQYNQQPQQQQYNNNNNYGYNQQQGGMPQRQQQEEKIPTIDIDNDEIPF